MRFKKGKKGGPGIIGLALPLAVILFIGWILLGGGFVTGLGLSGVPWWGWVILFIIILWFFKK